MRLFILFIGLGLFQSLSAQRTVDVTNGDFRLNGSSFYTVGGTPFVNEKYVKLIEGSPYFSDEWLKGIVVTSNGTEYKDISLKLNLHSNEVLYKNDKDEEMIATTPIKEVVLTDAEGNNYRFVHSSTLVQQEANPIKTGWYLWLCSGAAGLYKYYNKLMSESTPYGSATTEKRIKTKEKYLVSYNNAFIELPKLKDIPNVLANKKTELQEYLKKEEKTGNAEDRFVAIIEYYNSLFTEK